MSGRPAPWGPPARLLPADRDPTAGRVPHLALEAHGYQVTLAHSANVLLELAGQEHPDLIVLDRSLPGAARHIRLLRDFTVDLAARRVTTEGSEVRLTAGSNPSPPSRATSSPSPAWATTSNRRRKQARNEP